MEDHETRLKRLRIRSWRRGTKEMDMILGPFADQTMKTLTEEQLDAHEALMAEADTDLYAWISGQTPAPEHHKGAIALVLASLK